MKDITVGYLQLLGRGYISTVEIDDNFLNLLGRYIKIEIIPVKTKDGIKESFGKIEKCKLDYLYVDSFTFLLHSFLLRERLRLDIPFILKLHTVYPWAGSYAYVIPLLRKYDMILAPSEFAKESFLRISRKFNIEINPYFLDIQSIQKNISHNFKRKKKVITFLGRLTEEKGIGMLARCMPEVIAKVGNAHLSIIGPLSGVRMRDHPKSIYVKRLEGEVRRLKLTDRVHFEGVKRRLAKYKKLSESDVFVNPTMAEEETFSIVNIEALGCGVPVITTKWAANREIIINRKNGYLVDIDNDKKGNPKVNLKQMASFIVKVLENKKLLLKLKENAAKTAWNYDYRKILPKLVSLLRKRETQHEVKQRWDKLKNKRVIDFPHLFSKEFLFFLYCQKNVRAQTYASMYRKLIEAKTLKDRYSEREGEERGRERAYDTRITDAIRHSCLQFLTLRSD